MINKVYILIRFKEFNVKSSAIQTKYLPNETNFIHREFRVTKNEVYSCYYKLISVPMNSNISNITNDILPKYPYILVKGLKTESLAEPCQELDESRLLCPKTRTSPILKDDCIAALMKFSTNIICQLVPVFIEDNIKISHL